MDLLKKDIDLAKESGHVSYAFTDINCSLSVKYLMVRSSFSTLLVISMICRVLYFMILFFVIDLIRESV